MPLSPLRQGYLFALAAYLIWGIAPVYFKYIEHVPADEIVSHRMIWSFLFMSLLISLTGNWHNIRQIVRNSKGRILILALTATIIGCNWLLFIWAVNNQHMLEASMGYFITPLANMLLGMLFLGERFNARQWIALLLAFCAILVQLWQFGKLPIIGLGLAFTFSLYGLLRKKIGIDAQSGMFFETLWLLPLACIYLFFFAQSPTSNLSQNSIQFNLLLVAAGAVTTVPLLCFTAATSRLKLSTLGFFQYIGPTLTFLLAVTFYGENITYYTLLTFAFIWAALAMFIWNALSGRRSRVD